MTTFVANNRLEIIEVMIDSAGPLIVQIPNTTLFLRRVFKKITVSESTGLHTFTLWTPELTLGKVFPPGGEYLFENKDGFQSGDTLCYGQLDSGSSELLLFCER